jgi:hypothetical protein
MENGEWRLEIGDWRLEIADRQARVLTHVPVHGILTPHQRDKPRLGIHQSRDGSQGIPSPWR